MKATQLIVSSGNLKFAMNIPRLPEPQTRRSEHAHCSAYSGEVFEECPAIDRFVTLVTEKTWTRQTDLR